MEPCGEDLVEESGITIVRQAAENGGPRAVDRNARAVVVVYCKCPEAGSWQQKTAGDAHGECRVRVVRERLVEREASSRGVAEVVHLDDRAVCDGDRRGGCD